MENKLLKNKKPNYKKLENFGFKKEDKSYLYSTDILNSEFKLYVQISDGFFNTKLIENETGEIYSLHLIEGVEGSYIGKIKEEYEKAIFNIIDNCFDDNIFKTKDAKKIEEYASETYKSSLEYLWEKFPNNAVLRRGDNSKWYAAILTVKKSKLGLNSEDEAEVIDIRAKAENIPELLKKDGIYPGYHMNKKHWITIILDDIVPFYEIKKYIDESYLLAK